MGTMQGTYQNGSGGSNHTEPMSQKEMFNHHVSTPILDAFTGLADHLLLKTVLLITSLPAVLALDLFATPEGWWKGLVWLIVIDWVSGMITAASNQDFDIRIATKKWHQCTGYFAVCGSAAILSNTFDPFYYLQFFVYATFFLKEFISILQTFRVLSLFEAAWEIFVKRRVNIDTFREFKNEVDRRAQQIRNDKKGKK